MNTKTLQNHLSKYLTIKDIVKMGIPERNITRWISKGKKVQLKGYGYSDPVKLPVLKTKSDVLIGPVELAEFLTKIKREDLIVNIPTYQRL